MPTSSKPHIIIGTFVEKQKQTNKKRLRYVVVVLVGLEVEAVVTVVFVEAAVRLVFIYSFRLYRCSIFLLFSFSIVKNTTQKTEIYFCQRQSHN